MNGPHKGRRAEWRAQSILEKAGYLTTRAAGSKGPADVIAWNAQSVRFVSVKCGTKYASALERELLQAMPRPQNASVEIWRFPDRCKTPLIEVLP